MIWLVLLTPRAIKLRLSVQCVSRQIKVGWIPAHLETQDLGEMVPVAYHSSNSGSLCPPMTHWVMLKHPKGSTVLREIPNCP